MSIAFGQCKGKCLSGVTIAVSTILIPRLSSYQGICLIKLLFNLTSPSGGSVPSNVIFKLA